MGREEPLRISGDDCPGGTECRDCLVEFFLGERNARIVRLGNDAVPAAATDLDADLQAAFDNLHHRRPDPQVVATAATTAPPAPPEGVAFPGVWVSGGGQAEEGQR